MHMMRVMGAWLLVPVLALAAVLIPFGSPASAAPSDLCAQVSYAAGFRDSLVTAVAVALAESSCNPLATNSNPPPSQCTTSTDRGLFQINNCWHPEVPDACAFDAACNAVEAFRISGGGANWTPWSAYNNGAYRNHLAEAEAAVARLDRRGTTTVGWYRPSDSSFHLVNGHRTGGSDLAYVFGPANSGGIIPVTGDWNGA